MGVGQETRWLKAAAPWSKIPRPIAPCRSPRRLPNNVARKACAEAADAPCVVRGPLAGLVRRAALCRALPALEPRRARRGLSCRRGDRGDARRPAGLAPITGGALVGK